MDEQERYADPLDAGSARAEQWISEQIAEAQYQLGHAVSALEHGPGRCRNCAEMVDDSRPFCTVECRDDFAYRQKMNATRGRANV